MAPLRELVQQRQRQPRNQMGPPASVRGVTNIDFNDAFQRVGAASDAHLPSPHAGQGQHGAEGGGEGGFLGTPGSEYRY
jgi:hypothetical protein